ncbi:hypothetical protein HK098_006609 [Nowakowskiella sp. JEL0407]|nr:hypothetical protein HK098_006609 [Nowakowskiella sp. JEL0407]
MPEFPSALNSSSPPAQSPDSDPNPAVDLPNSPTTTPAPQTVPISEMEMKQTVPALISLEDFGAILANQERLVPEPMETAKEAPNQSSTHQTDADRDGSVRSNPQIRKSNAQSSTSTPIPFGSPADSTIPSSGSSTIDSSAFVESTGCNALSQNQNSTQNPNTTRTTTELSTMTDTPNVPTPSPSNRIETKETSTSTVYLNAISVRSVGTMTENLLRTRDASAGTVNSSTADIPVNDNEDVNETMENDAVSNQNSFSGEQIQSEIPQDIEFSETTIEAVDTDMLFAPSESIGQNSLIVDSFVLQNVPQQFNFQPTTPRREIKVTGERLLNVKEKELNKRTRIETKPVESTRKRGENKENHQIAREKIPVSSTQAFKSKTTTNVAETKETTKNEDDIATSSSAKSAAIEARPVNIAETQIVKAVAKLVSNAKDMNGESADKRIDQEPRQPVKETVRNHNQTYTDYEMNTSMTNSEMGSHAEPKESLNPELNHSVEQGDAYTKSNEIAIQSNEITSKSYVLSSSAPSVLESPHLNSKFSPQHSTPKELDSPGESNFITSIATVASESSNSAMSPTTARNIQNLDTFPSLAIPTLTNNHNNNQTTTKTLVEEMNEIASDFKKMDVRTDQKKQKNNDKTNQNAKKQVVVTGNRRNRELIIEILGESDDEDNDDDMTKVSEPSRVENAISTRKTFKLQSCLKKTSPCPQQTNPNPNSQPPNPSFYH